ncbi:PREDICTED: uncharacterized protein LOC102022613 [Chinchilla lanigera]|uniref:uncharacterized protein LOC102022613 n=1 Tax=Chinchilla lanigera TaxID=34839 RepID=UPI00038EADE3|nr:PREDICTED: uncharacterized protein LOC102022613 [Chinchilla lanigera]
MRASRRSALVEAQARYPVIHFGSPMSDISESTIPGGGSWLYRTDRRRPSNQSPRLRLRGGRVCRLSLVCTKAPVGLCLTRGGSFSSSHQVLLGRRKALKHTSLCSHPSRNDLPTSLHGECRWDLGAPSNAWLRQRLFCPVLPGVLLMDPHAQGQRQTAECPPSTSAWEFQDPSEPTARAPQRSEREDEKARLPGSAPSCHPQAWTAPGRPRWAKGPCHSGAAPGRRADPQPWIPTKRSAAAPGAKPGGVGPLSVPCRNTVSFDPHGLPLYRGGN